MKPLLKAIQISKDYGELSVLKSVDLEIKEKEIVTIVGPSGAGKTTLLHILGTLDTPSLGSQVIFDGVDTTRLKTKELARFRNQNMGFIFQFHELLPEFTALENVCIPGFIGKRNTLEVTKRATNLLGHLGLEQRLHHKPSQLSGGEQQRVAVARALINDPDLILADEPSGNLDSENAQSLYQLFQSLRNDFKQTFVIVTHNKEFAHLADRTAIMKDGVIIN